MKFKSAALLNCLTQQPVGSQIAAALLRRIQMSNRIIDFLLSVIRKRELDISNEQTVRQQRCSQSRREHRTTGSTQCKRSDCTQLALDHWLSRISHLPFLLDHFFSIISASAAFLSGVSRVQSLYYKLPATNCGLGGLLASPLGDCEFSGSERAMIPSFNH